MNTQKGGSTTYATPQLTEEQRRQVELQNKFASDVIIPTYQNVVKGGTELLNLSLPGLTNAAQNLAGRASQVGQTLGETSESAVRTGVAGLQSLFSPEYERQQLQAALAPAQQQYQQNLASQMANYGAAGQLGSARSALAQTALAGQTQASQQAAAANILKDIAAQRASVGSTLAQLGQSGLGQSIGAAKDVVGAAGSQMDLFNKYLPAIYGVPQASYALGPYGQSQSGSSQSFGIRI